MKNFGFHKRLFLVVIVVLPMWWLLFTDDGRSRSDTVILWLAGGETIGINFKELNNSYSIEDWQKVYPDMDWQCENKNNGFGDQYCYSEIASYNGIPANYVTVFFRQGQVSALKLVYRNQYHQRMGEDLHQQLGTPLLRQDQQEQHDMLQWNTDHGVVMIKQQIQPEEQASLIWLAQ